jgi:hypothetical protein
MVITRALAITQNDHSITLCFVMEKQAIWLSSRRLMNAPINSC